MTNGGAPRSDAARTPISVVIPNMELLPGPPCSQISTGAEALPSSAGQYQENSDALAAAST